MSSYDQTRPGNNIIEDLMMRIERLERHVRDLHSETYIPFRDFNAQGTAIPSDGKLVINYSGVPGDGAATHVPMYAYGGVWHPISEAIYEVKIVADSAFLSVGDGQFTFGIPAQLNGFKLYDAHCLLSAASTSGLPTVQIRNVTTAVDMLSTRITIDVSEFSSYTASTPHVVNPANALVATADRITFDIDVAGTVAKGLMAVLRFRL